MMAMKIHQPAKHVTKVNAPPAWRRALADVLRVERGEELTSTSFAAFAAAIVLAGFSYTKARLKYAPARHANAQTRVKKMVKKTMLVRSEQIRKTKQISPEILLES